MICIPVMDATHREALRSAEKSAVLADAIELRLDRIADGDVTALIRAARRASAGVKIIVTCRRREESELAREGLEALSVKERTKAAKMKLLREAVVSGADFIDIELAEGEGAISRVRTWCHGRSTPARLIVSWHHPYKTPSLASLKKIFKACVQAGADIVKMVPYARSLSDNADVLNLIDHAKSQGREIIAMCMGEKGQISRVLAPSRGSFLGFAVLPGGLASAPGQLTLREMRAFQKLLRPHRQSVEPRQDPLHFVLLGNPVRQSLSPLMHQSVFRAMEMNASYSAFCVSDLAAAVAGIRAMNIRGASVTIPFKTAVMDYLDEIEADAAAVGAVNTIVNDDGRLIGHNTDWLGLMSALRAQTDIKGKKFIILGAGGTARAAAYGIRKEGGRPIIVNRTPEKGMALAMQFGCPLYPLAQIGKIRAFGLINATPVGMFPDIQKSPVPPSVLANYRVVADVVYHPLKTKLLRDAEAKGCRVIPGLEMFVRQGAQQSMLWTGRTAPLAVMRNAVLERLMQHEF
ncbi:MAG TPA: shikimate dehydrogenase [Smithellaceae bacterium]|nr:shikimate dehydrogenase [Smithellaceae bacterium]HRS81919.1 shikimate dehydrogenase [Smithellaceae bacterium]